MSSLSLKFFFQLSRVGSGKAAALLQMHLHETKQHREGRKDVPSRLDYRRQMSLARGASPARAFAEKGRRERAAVSAMPDCVAQEITASFWRKMTHPRFIAFCISLARSFRKRQASGQKSKSLALPLKTLPCARRTRRIGQLIGTDSSNRSSRVTGRFISKANSRPDGQLSVLSVPSDGSISLRRCHN